MASSLRLSSNNHFGHFSFVSLSGIEALNNEDNVITQRKALWVSMQHSTHYGFQRADENECGAARVTGFLQLDLIWKRTENNGMGGAFITAGETGLK